MKPSEVASLGGKTVMNVQIGLQTTEKQLNVQWGSESLTSM